MKKSNIILIILAAFSVVALLFIISFGSSKNESYKSSGSEDKGATKNSLIKAETLEIIYFHTSNRCTLCIRAEEFIENTMKEFESEIKAAKITYRAVNIDDKTNKEIVEKYQARGSSLFFGLNTNDEEILMEEVEAWRYLSKEEDFKKHLVVKINSLLES